MIKDNPVPMLSVQNPAFIYLPICPFIICTFLYPPVQLFTYPPLILQGPCEKSEQSNCLGRQISKLPPFWRGVSLVNEMDFSTSLYVHIMAIDCLWSTRDVEQCAYNRELQAHSIVVKFCKLKVVDNIRFI
jgi:hypothetical protein